MSKQQTLLNILASDKEVAYDVETTGLDYHRCHVIGYSVSDGQSAVYVPVRHTPGGNIEGVEQFESEIKRTIANRDKPLIAHNAKFDSHFSNIHGIELGNKIVDTMIAACLLDENQNSYALSKVAHQYPDIPQKKESALYGHIANITGCKPTRTSMSNYHLLRGDDQIAIEYAESDTLATWHVREKQKIEIYGQNLDFVYDLENKLSHVLRKMESRGVKIDLEELEKVRLEVEELRVQVYQKIPLDENFLPINIRSNHDLQDYFRMHEVTDWEYTEPTDRFPQGQPSFNKIFLSLSEPGKVLLEARAFDHFKNSFLDPIDKYIYNGSIYTNFNQVQGEYGSGTKTGRLSCNHPNMQQVPKRDKQLGKIFRKIFISRPGYTFVEFDYSQAEPRLFSHYSDEPVLTNGYNSQPPIDMHSIAADLMHITREKAKNLNLGIMYTMGKDKLARQLGADIATATDMYYGWKKAFPRANAFTKKAATVAEQRGYVKTILGRRRHFPDPRWAYRAANSIVQGGSADILKYKMVEIDNYLVDNNLENDIRMLLNIHDALLFEIKDELIDEYVPKIASIMQNVQIPPFNLKVPFVADYRKDYKLGKNWKIATYGVD